MRVSRPWQQVNPFAAPFARRFFEDICLIKQGIQHGSGQHGFGLADRCRHRCRRRHHWNRRFHPSACNEPLRPQKLCPESPARLYPRRHGPGRVHWPRVAEAFQQRRRAGHAQIPQPPAHREGGAPEGVAPVEVLRAVVEVP